MNLHLIKAILAQTNLGQTNAPAGTPMQEDPKAAMIRQFTWMAVILFAGYMLLIRPQSKKAKELAATIKTVKAGDKIVTSSGIVGIVVAVKDRTISLRSAETKLEVLKSAISEISKGSDDTEESQPSKS